MRKAILIILLITTIIAGCSGHGDPMAPEEKLVESSQVMHSLWGLWQGTIDPELGTIEMVSLRLADMHLNALPFLEPPALVNLTLDAVEFNGNVVTADIGLRHPFLGLDEFTGFDVCGIFITQGSVSGFSDTDIVMPGITDTRLLNPDAYSRWWNPAEFPVNIGTMLAYNDGLLGTPDSSANFTATLNGYKYYCDDLNDITDTMDDVTLAGRGHFSAGQKNVRRFEIEIGDSGLVFNYAIDASWKFPSGGPPYNVPGDFDPDANRPEAWKISITETENSLWNDGSGNGSGGTLNLTIEVYDWFNADLNTVRVESPNNFLAVTSATPVNGGPGYSTYEIEITNATPAQDSIDLLIGVESDSVGYGGLLPGKPVTSYFTGTADVSPNPPQSLEGGAITFGGPGTEYILGFTVDSQGGKYCGGYFFGEANLDPDGNDPHNAVGGGNMWLNKVDANGTFQWGYTWPSMVGYHCYIWAIVADASDDIYVVGHFVGTLDFDPGAGVDDHTASSGNGRLDGFLMKFDSDGNYIWGESWGGLQDVTAFDIVLDGNGNAYITGYFFGTADIDPSNGVDQRVATSSSGNVTDCYLIKVDTDGGYAWGRAWGAGGTAYAFDCAVDGSGNPSSIGTFQNTVDLDPTTGTQNETSNGAGDAFLIRFLADGTWQWSVAYGGNSWDQANAICADSSGNIYINGGFSSSSVDFDPGPGIENVNNLGSYDGFMCKYDSSGTFLWVNIFAGTDHDNTWGIALDASENILMAGHFKDTIDLDPGAGNDQHISNGEADAYVVKLNSDGEYIWATSWGGALFDNAQAVDLASNGLVHVAGRFSDTVDFDPGPGIYERTSNGLYDTFIDMFDPSTGEW